jgi:hypothetical protein
VMAGRKEFSSGRVFKGTERQSHEWVEYCPASESVLDVDDFSGMGMSWRSWSASTLVSGYCVISRSVWGGCRWPSSEWGDHPGQS